MADQVGGVDPHSDIDDGQNSVKNSNDDAIGSESNDLENDPVTDSGDGDVHESGHEPQSGDASAGVFEVESLVKQLEAAKAEVAEQKDHMLRAEAEMKNSRRRAERDVENAHRFALEKFVNDLLPVIDGLERGLDAVPEDDEAQQVSREGMVLTLKMFADVLTKYNVESVSPLGEPFDPKIHQAMSMQESNDAEPNSVLMVVQKGYQLNGRLIRPAMVIVSKAEAKTDAQT